ncbi:hypothetical protein [Fimbriiglobus ruber]|uniref:Uncharacterized protein n=1 Tax=Fimbriiglobus ruber TaxID=1908690 RepID=A0A225DGQ0_9BACT|nr:hypothetical protein [Fimbriiglobus ruber]OWK40133.1 hypothetical protein FRUB_05052 [Fimbriiglobus ruber]
MAGELGRAVADAVRDLLTAVLRGHPAPVPPPVRRDRWDDDPDDWDRQPRDRWDAPDDPDEPRPAAGGWRPEWAGAVAAAAAVGRWLFARRLPLWAATGVGVVVGATALAGGPAARAVAGALAAAIDLARLTDPPAAF